MIMIIATNWTLVWNSA